MSQAKGDFGAVYANHGAAVYRFALYLCGEPADAEDIAAEAFARAWTSPAPIVDETVRGYLLTIAKHVYLQRVRSGGRTVALEGHDPGASTEARLEARAELRSVNARLKALPADDRVALLMRVDGNSYEEIAAALGITPGAARVRVHRVRAILARARLGDTKP